MESLLGVEFLAKGGRKNSLLVEAWLEAAAWKLQERESAD